MAIDHCLAADARLAADLSAIHNPHAVEYLGIAIGQSVVADLCRAENFWVVTIIRARVLQKPRPQYENVGAENLVSF